jgi:hypothetical protein
VTHQDIFDRTVRHLFTQGGPSKFQPPGEPQPSCAYRGDEGRKCAAGIWIKDENYSPALEGMLIDSTGGFIRMEPALRLALDFEDDSDLVLLSRLQNIHDTATSDGRSWDRVWAGSAGIAARLWRLARDYGLNSDVISECWPVLIVNPVES